MNEIVTIVVYAFCAGITVFLGGVLSMVFEKFKDHTLHKIIIHVATAFGGGILIAAAAFVLIPKGMEHFSAFALVIIFLLGVFFFCFLDRKIAEKGTPLAQSMAMLMDFIPEAIALGAVFAHDINLGLLLAIFIGLQNLPEAYNSYIEMKKYNHSSEKSLLILFFLSFVGIGAALIGNFLLRDSSLLIAGLMIFSGGGIIFLMFQDIIPAAKLKNSWIPAIAASAGFLVGMVGQKLLG